MIKICETCGKEKDMCSWEHSCYSCQKKAERDKLVANILNGSVTKTDSEEDIVCPYCGCYWDPDCYEESLYMNGLDGECCPECEKTFIVEAEIRLYYSTRQVK